MIEVVSEFIARGTVRTLAYVYNDGGTLVNATKAEIKIVGPSSTPVPGTNEMTNEGTGIYQHLLHLGGTAEVGEYSGQVDIIDGSGGTAPHTPANFSFNVKGAL